MGKNDFNSIKSRIFYAKTLINLEKCLKPKITIEINGKFELKLNLISR